MPDLHDVIGTYTHRSRAPDRRAAHIPVMTNHQRRGMYRTEAKNLVEYRDSLRVSRRTVEEIDQVTTTLAEDSPLKEKLARERKSLAGHQPTLERLHEQYRERVEKYLEPFQQFAVSVRSEDPAAMIAQAERLEAEATRQTMLSGWPEDPATCPASPAELRA